MHVEGYARTIGKGKEGGNNCAKVVAEAERQDGACPHVAKPEKPILLYGVSPSETLKLAEAWAEASTDARGHKLRKDALCMLAGVISVPEDLTEEDWKKFKGNALKWLKNEYGKRLRTVVEHTDEEHRHIHFMAVPLAKERFEVLHDGVKAQNAANQKRGSRKATKEEKQVGYKEGRAAYAEAMRKFQDRFFTAVGKKAGLARIGPSRRRLTRAEWLAEKAANRAYKDRTAEIEAEQEKLCIYKNKLEKQMETYGNIMKKTVEEQKVLQRLQEEQPHNYRMMRELLKNVPPENLGKAWAQFKQVADTLSRTDRFPPGSTAERPKTPQNQPNEPEQGRGR